MYDKLYLLYKFSNLKNIESDVIKALERWDQRPELVNYLPESIIFNSNLNEEIIEDYILTLKVKFNKTVQVGHFMVEGVNYK